MVVIINSSVSLGVFVIRRFFHIIIRVFITSNCVNNLFIILTYSISKTGHHSIHVESAQTTIELLIETERKKKPSELLM